MPDEEYFNRLKNDRKQVGESRKNTGPTKESWDKILENTSASLSDEELKEIIKNLGGPEM